LGKLKKEIHLKRVSWLPGLIENISVVFIQHCVFVTIYDYVSAHMLMFNYDLMTNPVSSVGCQHGKSPTALLQFQSGFILHNYTNTFTLLIQ
jgi:hypothetical protein